MAVGIGFSQLFQGIGKGLPSSSIPKSSDSIYSYQVKSAELLFHRQFSNQV